MRFNMNGHLSIEFGITEKFVSPSIFKKKKKISAFIDNV